MDSSLSPPPDQGDAILRVILVVSREQFWQSNQSIRIELLQYPVQTVPVLYKRTDSTPIFWNFTAVLPITVQYSSLELLLVDEQAKVARMTAYYT